MAQVIIVTSTYNEFPINTEIVGVYGTNEAFKVGIRDVIRSYAEEHYPEEDILENLGYGIEEYIDTIVNSLRRTDEAVDPMDDSQSWTLHDKTIKQLDYIKEILKVLPDEGLDFIKEDISFYPYALDGGESGELSKIARIEYCENDKTDMDDVLMADSDGDTYWYLSDQPLHKQRELWYKLMAYGLVKG